MQALPYPLHFSLCILTVMYACVYNLCMQSCIHVSAEYVLKAYTCYVTIGGLYRRCQNKSEPPMHAVLYMLITLLYWMQCQLHQLQVHPTPHHQIQQYKHQFPLQKVTYKVEPFAVLCTVHVWISGPLLS